MEFRYAERKDTALILQFIMELADYEKMLNEVVADEKTLEEWIFDKQKAEVIFLLEGGREIGFYHLSYKLGFCLFFYLFGIFKIKFVFVALYLIILPQFQERGNSLFFKLVSYLSDIRDGWSFRCRLYRTFQKPLGAVRFSRYNGRQEWRCRQ